MSVADAVDEKLLNLLQRQFPLEPRPFAVLAAALSTTEEEVLARVRRLKEQKVIRQVGAIFDSRRLGYQSCLVAAKVAPERLEAAAAVINGHPGVSHNYQRTHHFNLWFTLTVPPGRDLQAEAERLQREAGAESLRLLPTVRLFKIGVMLDVNGGEDAARRTDESVPAPAEAPLAPLTAAEIAAVRALQQDLPLEPFPFATLAAGAGMSEAELLQHARRLLEEGRMRRFAAVLHHRRAGFVANGMGVWNVPDERAVAVGEQMATFAAVSHCYQRPRYPDWPYNLFTMIHARSTEECEHVAATIAAETGISDYALLYSTREFKKVRVRYFEW